MRATSSRIASRNFGIWMDSCATNAEFDDYDAAAVVASSTASASAAVATATSATATYDDDDDDDDDVADATDP